MSTYVAVNNKPSERSTKESILRVHLSPVFGATNLDKIGAEEVERYKASKLAAGASPKSVNNHLTILRKILATAHEWGRIDRIPRVRWCKLPDAEFDFLTFEEADRLVAGADPGMWRSMVTLALRTGLRQSELLALRWDDVDLPASVLTVRRAVVRGIVGTPKNGRTRKVELSDHAKAALRDLPSRFRGELVFCAEDGRMLTKGEAKHPLWRACRRAGLRRIGWHVLRHTFASHLTMLGEPIRTVQDLMGHRTITMTMRYAHLSPEARRGSVMRLDRSGERSGNDRAAEA